MLAQNHLPIATNKHKIPCFAEYTKLLTAKATQMELCHMIFQQTHSLQ
jgi:hypothetical protein